jgi:hypothetical protein
MWQIDNCWLPGARVRIVCLPIPDCASKSKCWPRRWGTATRRLHSTGCAARPLTDADLAELIPERRQGTLADSEISNQMMTFRSKNCPFIHARKTPGS